VSESTRPEHLLADIPERTSNFYGVYLSADTPEGLVQALRDLSARGGNRPMTISIRGEVPSDTCAAIQYQGETLFELREARLDLIPKGHKVVCEN